MKQTKGRLTRDGAEVRRVQVMLDEATIDEAKKLGAGNLSAGIRKAAKEAAIMKRHQLEAICKMAEATHEYNLGVLCMLGHELLARRHESAAKWVTMLVAQRDMLTPDDASPLDPLPPEAEKIQAEIDAEVRHRNAMWEPIQAIIDEARKALDEADPMGMGQSV